jgi:fimbrial chaperone protein
MGLLGLCALVPHVAQASSWSVSPTRIEMTAPSVASVVTLTNSGKDVVNAQIRVFRWTQVNGVEQLTPTTDVVASPPAARLTPANNYLVRVVRVSKSPIAAEENYRLLIDELPDPSKGQNGMVSFSVRFSVPVFFKNPEAPVAPKIAWALRQTDQGVVLSAANSGHNRLRLHDVKLIQNGKTVATIKDLAGYVLAGATMEFPLDPGKTAMKPGTVRLTAQSDAGAIEADVTLGN